VERRGSKQSAEIGVGTPLAGQLSAINSSINGSPADSSLSSRSHSQPKQVKKRLSLDVNESDLKAKTGEEGKRSSSLRSTGEKPTGDKAKGQAVDYAMQSIKMVQAGQRLLYDQASQLLNSCAPQTSNSKANVESEENSMNVVRVKPAGSWHAIGAELCNGSKLV
tara:strand:- start:576 stop:1070 length:495 start_codon:yes stop_codon:yes gene_type:complete